MGKRERKIKKRFKRQVEYHIKNALRQGECCYLLMPYMEVFDIISPNMSSVEKNKRINRYANLWTHEVPPILRATETRKLGFHNDYPMGDIGMVPPPLSFRWIPTVEERIISLSMMIALDIPEDKGLVGKGFYQIVEEFDKYTMTTEEFDKQYSGIGDKFGAKASPNRLRVRSALATATKRYDFFVFNAWTKCFWYKPWLREVVREQGISYLPTVTLK